MFKYSFEVFSTITVIAMGVCIADVTTNGLTMLSLTTVFIAGGSTLMSWMAVYFGEQQGEY